MQPCEQMWSYPVAIILILKASGEHHGPGWNPPGSNLKSSPYQQHLVPHRTFLMCLNRRDVTDLGVWQLTTQKPTELRLVVRKVCFISETGHQRTGQPPVQRPKSPTLLSTENHWGRAFADRGKGLRVETAVRPDSHRGMSHVLVWSSW